MTVSKKLVLNVTAVAIAAFTMTGCSALQETLASQMEVPTLEKQANRVSIGMTIVRENNIIEKMPISADAVWPTTVSADLSDAQKQLISELLMKDPYYATVHYTKGIQRKMLGSGALMNSLGNYGNIAGQLLDQTISPLDYVAIQKIIVFYGEDEKNWPNVFNFNTTLDNILKFTNGKLKEIESPTGDVHDNIHKAVIALAPVNLQKDLETAQGESRDAVENVAALEGSKGGIKTQLDSGKASDGETALTDSAKSSLKEELALKEQELKEAESIANEKEAIYFELLDGVVLALESDVNTDDENYVKLAKNINIVANEIQESATEAYTAFGIALTQLAANGALMNFPKELQSLAAAKAHVPANLQAKYDTRVARIVKNALELLPNVGMGTYYAHKQAVVAEKYENITNKILEVYNTKKEQDEEAKIAEDEAAAAEEATVAANDK